MTNLQELLDHLREIAEEERQIRDHINKWRYQSVLLESHDTWNQICSSLDCIGDTALSMSDYLSSPYPNSAGLSYIYTYGILQSTFIQQDAIRHLAEAFEIALTLSNELLDIRETRNSSIGHPSKQNLGGIKNYNYISRISMHKFGFTLLRTNSRDSNRFIEVDLALILKNQTSEALKLLKKISGRLAEMDSEHKERYKKQPLVDSLPPTMDYFFEKISEGIHSSQHYGTDFAKSMLGLIRQSYEKFETALKERGELHDYTAYDLKEYHTAIDWMEQFLSGGLENATKNDGAIYLFYLRERHKHFLQLAKEIDEEYQSD